MIWDELEKDESIQSNAVKFITNKENKEIPFMYVLYYT